MSPPATPAGFLVLDWIAYVRQPLHSRTESTGTNVGEDAVAAARALSVTDMASVLYQAHVKGVDALRRDQRFEMYVCPLGVHLRRQQAQALRDTEDVRIDRQGRPAERKQQHARGGLGADAG